MVIHGVRLRGVNERGHIKNNACRARLKVLGPTIKNIRRAGQRVAHSNLLMGVNQSSPACGKTE